MRPWRASCAVTKSTACCSISSTGSDLDERAAKPNCLALRGPDALAVTICRAAGSERPATIVLELPAALGGGSTTLELDDWRAVHGVQLPFAVDFLHAGERHTYRYSEVLPFRVAPGVDLPRGAEAADPLFARLGDLAALASAHERTLAAHRQSDVRLLLDDAAERSLVSGRGTLKETGSDELAARLGPYLESIRFTRYEDVVVPVVAVSADGSLGWLACQIEAAGESRVSKLADGSAEPIAYGFSWIELYARSDGALEEHRQRLERPTLRECRPIPSLRKELRMSNPERTVHPAVLSRRLRALLRLRPTECARAPSRRAHGRATRSSRASRRGRSRSRCPASSTAD